MKKIRVERLKEYTNDMQEYEVITKEEALKAIDNFNIAETLVDYVSSQLGCIIEIDIETGEVYSKLNDGSFTLGDTTTIRFVAKIEPYYNLDSLSQIVEEYKDFNDFKEQYEKWEDEIEQEYDYEFDSDKYGDVYEAYVVEVLKEDSREFHTCELIDTMDENIGCEIYEDTEKFYDEAKVIMEI
jgi:hypothetical protein